MDRRTFDVIVVGVGAMGAAACYQLARRGVRVLGLERHSVPNALGSSHGATRMIRMAYYEHPDYVPLLKRAYELWHELEAASGEKVLYEVGGVYAGAAGDPVVAGSLASAREHGLAHESLSAAEVMTRWPAFQLPEEWVALYEARAGFLRCERAVSVQAELAMRAGAEIHGHEAVGDWHEEQGGVVVRTEKGEYACGELVLSPGAWAEGVVGELGVKVVVTRQVLGWVWPREPEAFALGRFPVWAISRKDGSIDYGFPMIEEPPGVKLAHHGKGEVTSAEAVERAVKAGDEADFRFALSRYLPGADGQTLAMKVCLYTNSPDGHFIVDRHPGYKRATFACGFSGHGFKFASVMGEVLADLAVEGRTERPVGFLGVRRFG